MKQKTALRKINYNEILTDVIPHLDEFSYLSGSEGMVYFIDDDFIVKKYFDHTYNLEIFETFCEEMNNFAQMGFKVPRVYASLVQPISKTANEFYVLRERVKGKSLSIPQISEMYHEFKDVCSKKHFDHTVSNGIVDKDLYEEIFVQYVKNHININGELLNLQDPNLERFISAYFHMDNKSISSAVDFQHSNVIFDGKNIHFIDNAIVSFYNSPKTEKESREQVVVDMIYLFYEFANLQNTQKAVPVNSAKIMQLKKENSEICFEAMMRYLKKSREVLGSAKLTGFNYSAGEGMASKIFDTKRAGAIIAEIEK